MKNVVIPPVIVSDEQERFCLAFVQSRNVALSYRSTHEPANPWTRPNHYAAGMALLKQEHIRERIVAIQSELNQNGVMDVMDVLQRWVAIATADVDELIGLRVGACRYCHGADGLYQWRQTEYIEALERAQKQLNAGLQGVELPEIRGGFGYDATREPNPECTQCDGEGVERIVARDTSKLSPSAQLLYNGVKQTRNGIEIVVADRGKALEAVTRMLGGFKDAGVIAPQTNIQNNIFAGTLDEATRAYEKLIKGNT